MNSGNDLAESFFPTPGNSEVEHKVEIKIVSDYEGKAAKFGLLAAPGEQ